MSGVDRAFLLGGVQALAAMAFGLLGEAPVDMIVGAGNAYVAEAKRQLFGTVAIDLLAGPSEVAVIADETADPELVAADLLGQAEHGPDSPAALVTTDAGLAEAVAARGASGSCRRLSTSEICGPAWQNYGSITVAQDRETAVALMDDLAPEHLEIQTADDDWYHDHLRNYGSLFLGTWSTVAYSDKGMAGTNHVLPTAGGAKHSAGLSVSRFLKPLTYQRVSARSDAVAGRRGRCHLCVRRHGSAPSHRHAAQGPLAELNGRRRPDDGKPQECSTTTDPSPHRRQRHDRYAYLLEARGIVKNYGHVEVLRENRLPRRAGQGHRADR